MNYYNEIDPQMAAWLTEQIKEGLIPDGDIDTRDIRDVAPGDLDGYTQCHFFAGIGGWAHALRMANWGSGGPVWTGSCPCQPFSCAGKGRALDDDRHLWPAFRWLIAKCRPAVVFGEQVASKDGRAWLSGVRLDMEAMDYQFGGADLCAAGIGSPQIRQRLFWVADNSRIGCDTRGSDNRKYDGPKPGTTMQAGRLSDHAGHPGPKHERQPGKRPRGLSKKNNSAECKGSFCGISDQHRTGFQGGVQRRKDQGRESIPGHSGHSGAVDWSQSVWWPCKDGKWRRIPARRVDTADGAARQLGDCGSRQAGIAETAQGWVPFAFGADTPDENTADRGGLEPEPLLFPLADGIPGRCGLLRGSGNAIVPQLAAEFIIACGEAIGI